MWTRILVTLLAVGCMAFGVYGLARPGAAGELVSLVPTGPEGVGEIRAVYGGLMIAVGALLLWGSMGKRRSAAWLVAVGVGFAGLFVGRLVSLLLDGLTGYTLMATVLEGGVAGLLFVAAAEQRSRAATDKAPETKPGPEVTGGEAARPGREDPEHRRRGEREPSGEAGEGPDEAGERSGNDDDDRPGEVPGGGAA